MKSWKNIKIFVSSTFQDMDSERDALKLIVEPLLNEDLREYGCSLEFIDLRHSVKTDSSLSLLEREKQIFGICLDEIENCHPYFMGILGHRYGWIPAQDGVPSPDIYIPDNFPIEKDKLSVTMYEFLHGILSPEKPKDRNIIFLRNEESYLNLSYQEKEKYTDKGEKRELIDCAREYIRKLPDVKVQDYYFPLDSGDNNAIVEWTQLVASNIKSLIASELLDKVTSPEEVYNMAQENYVRNYIRNFKGREEDIKYFIEDLENKGGVIIAAEEKGLGVTSFFCKIYDYLRQDKSNICLFYSRKADESFKLEDVLYCWLRNINSKINIDFSNKIEDACKDMEKLIEVWKEMLPVTERQGLTIYWFCESLEDKNKLNEIADSSIFAVTTYYYNVELTFILPLMYIIEPYNEDTLKEIIAPFRLKVREAIMKKESKNKASWLSFVTDILNNLNKLDYLRIRSRNEEDNEERILNHQIELVKEIPESMDDLIIFWISRLKTIFGQELINNYLFLMSINKEGWNDDTLSILLDCEFIDLITIRQMLGKRIVSLNSEGLWAFADEDMMSMITSKLEIKNFKPLISKTYKYITSLEKNNRLRKLLLFKCAMLDNDIDSCRNFIISHSLDSSALEVLKAREAFTEMATYFNLEYLNFYNKLLSQNKSVSKVFYENLLQWIKPLFNIEDVYLISIDKIYDSLRAKWINKEIDTDIYSIIGNVLAFKADFYREKGLYKKWERTINEGLKLCEDFIAHEAAFLPFYFYFVNKKLIMLKNNPNEAYAWLEKVFINPEVQNKFRLKPNSDISIYGSLLFDTVKIMCYTGNDDYADDFCMKSFNLFYDFLQSQKEGKAHSILGQEDTIRNLVYILMDSMKLRFHFGLLERRHIEEMAEKVFSECDDTILNLKKHTGRTYPWFYKARAAYYFMLDSPEEEIFKKLMDQADVISKQSKSFWKTYFLVKEMNERKISSEFEAWLYTVSLAMYVLSDKPDGKLPYDDSKGWLRGKEDAEEDQGIINFNSYLRKIIMTLNNKEIDERGFPDYRIQDSLVILYFSMMYNEMQKEEFNLQYLIALFNSVSDLINEIGRSGSTIRMEDFAENHKSILEFLKEALADNNINDFDLNARFQPIKNKLNK